jgi:hypothetical protein
LLLLRILYTNDQKKKIQLLLLFKKLLIHVYDELGYGMVHMDEVMSSIAEYLSTFLKCLFGAGRFG